MDRHDTRDIRDAGGTAAPRAQVLPAPDRRSRPDRGSTAEFAEPWAARVARSMWGRLTRHDTAAEECFR